MMMIFEVESSSAVGELRRVLVDPLHHARRVVELVDRPLQLLVEHGPVGDHDDLVEHLLVRVGEQVDSRCASHAIVLDFPDPAECSIR